MHTTPTNSPQTAIVTGGSQGLGLELIQSLVDAGWHVVTNARNAATLRSATTRFGSVVTAIAGDIADPAHQQHLVDAAVHSGGSIDLVVNNASTLGTLPMPSLLNTSQQSLLDVFRINVDAPLGLIQRAAPYFADDPVIINVSSDAGVEGYPRWGAYGISKAALDHLSRVLAAEHPNWRVLSIDPGDMRTAMHQDAFPGEDITDRPEPSTSVPGILALINGSYPSGRYSARDVPANNELEVA
jgi:NAD(P)-dependent dehydrogenase (short-subunit alcohol dehydrogenase family)